MEEIWVVLQVTIAGAVICSLLSLILNSPSDVLIEDRKKKELHLLLNKIFVSTEQNFIRGYQILHKRMETGEVSVTAEIQTIIKSFSDIPFKEIEPQVRMSWMDTAPEFPFIKLKEWDHRVEELKRSHKTEKEEIRKISKSVDQMVEAETFQYYYGVNPTLSEPFMNDVLLEIEEHKKNISTQLDILAATVQNHRIIEEIKSIQVRLMKSPEEHLAMTKKEQMPA
ncbi:MULTISPECIES: hypothetical protein [unclassified Psychrobacillus]|uniref:hypothetical protein n=1 Tax=unclassified Psychrobacillus TaxID=2636677 RepID=UPI0030F7EA98